MIQNNELRKLYYESGTRMSSYNISAECYCCGNTVAMIVTGELYETYDSNSGITKRSKPSFAIGYCPQCRRPLIFDYSNNITIPYVRSFDNVKHLPAAIESLYNEIRDAYSIRAFTCCVISGRTLLANIAIEQGAEEGKSFVYYVDYLVSNFLPASNSKPWVDRVRELGNEATHHFCIATQEQAKISLKFLEAILKNVYEFPNSI